MSKGSFMEGSWKVLEESWRAHERLKGEVNSFPRGSAEWISVRYAALRAAPGSKISL